MKTKHKQENKEINEKVNRTQDFTWFSQLCLRPRSYRDFTNFGEKLRVTMFGGYLAFYIKESKALNINMKTDYWAHLKNKLHNPTISHLETVSTTSVAHLVFHLPSPIFATQSLCLQARRSIEIVHNLNFSIVTPFVNISAGF